jgi:magnesium-transporting ATPase (P-type)
MGETVAIVTNGAEHASQANHASSDSSPPPAQDDQPPIPEPPDILAKEKQSLPHTLSAQHVAELFKTNLYDGLTHDEAAARLARDGPNSIKGAKGVSLWEIFLAQVANALTAVLIAVAALSFAIDDYIEGGVVMAVILLNIIVG